MEDSRLRVLSDGHDVVRQVEHEFVGLDTP